MSSLLSWEAPENICVIKRLYQAFAYKALILLFLLNVWHLGLVVSALSSRGHVLLPPVVHFHSVLLER